MWISVGAGAGRAICAGLSQMLKKKIN